MIREPGSRLIHTAKVSSLSKRPVRKVESGTNGLGVKRKVFNDSQLWSAVRVVW